MIVSQTKRGIMSKTLEGKTIVITGASRGIGRSIALKAASHGANCVLASKTITPHPKLPGTLNTVAEEVRALGAKAHVVQTDVRHEEAVQNMVDEAVKTFGGIDYLVNNAGAIMLTPTEMTPMKRYDLMQQVNTRATVMCAQKAFPHLKESAKKGHNPHIVSLSPPVLLKERWVSGYTPYSISKFGMSIATMGMAGEFRDDGVAVNSLWPKTMIATAAVNMLAGDEGMKASRQPEIMSDAVYEIITTKDCELTGNWLIDEEFLSTRGVSDFDKYLTTPGLAPLPDLYIE